MRPSVDATLCQVKSNVTQSTWRINLDSTASGDFVRLPGCLGSCEDHFADLVVCRYGAGVKLVDCMNACTHYATERYKHTSLQLVACCCAICDMYSVNDKVQRS